MIVYADNTRSVEIALARILEAQGLQTVVEMISDWAYTQAENPWKHGPKQAVKWHEAGKKLADLTLQISANL